AGRGGRDQQRDCIPAVHHAAHRGVPLAQSLSQGRREVPNAARAPRAGVKVAITAAQRAVSWLDCGFLGCQRPARRLRSSRRWRSVHWRMQMTSEPIRDPLIDHLLTPSNSALVVIDYQPLQLQVMTSMDREVLVDNIVSVARLARTYDLPVVLSTVNAADGQGTTLPEIKAALPDTPEIDRTTM